MTTKIPCPSCGKAFFIDFHALIKSASFSCQNCSASIALSRGSGEVAVKALTSFEELKQSTLDNSD